MTASGSPLVGNVARVACWAGVSLALHCLKPDAGSGRLVSTYASYRIHRRVWTTSMVSSGSATCATARHAASHSRRLAELRVRRVGRWQRRRHTRPSRSARSNTTPPVADHRRRDVGRALDPHVHAEALGRDRQEAAARAREPACHHRRRDRVEAGPPLVAEARQLVIGDGHDDVEIGQRVGVAAGDRAVHPHRLDPGVGGQDVDRAVEQVPVADRQHRHRLAERRRLCVHSQSLRIGDGDVDPVGDGGIEHGPMAHRPLEVGADGLDRARVAAGGAPTRHRRRCRPASRANIGPATTGSCRSARRDRRARGRTRRRRPAPIAPPPRVPSCGSRPTATRGARRRGCAGRARRRPSR